MKLGGLRDKTNQRNKAIQEQALERANKLKGIIIPMRENGVTLNGISIELNKLNIATPRGGLWTATSVKRVLARLCP